MNLCALNCFCTVVDVGSISAVAKQLHLTQPAISQQIQGLEMELGAILLHRHNKGVEPTEAGRVVYEYGRALLQLESNLHRDLDQLRSTQPKLLVGAASAVGGYALPCSLYLFKQRQPDTSVVLRVENSDMVLQLLKDRSLDVGLVEGPLPAGCELKAEPLAIDELCLVTAGRVPKEGVDLAELLKLPHVIRAPGSGLRRTVVRTLEEQGHSLNELNVALELPSLEAVKSAVAAGLGVALLPPLALRRELRSGSLKVIPLRAISFKQPVSIVYSGRTLPSAAEAFLQFLRSPKLRGFC